MRPTHSHLKGQKSSYLLRAVLPLPLGPEHFHLAGAVRARVLALQRAGVGVTC